MSKLNTMPNLVRPDDLYERLIRLHDGLSDAESAVVNAKLILLLANHIGDLEVIQQSIALARGDQAAPAV
ncbi:MAG TPA: DUF2783 domain-containing protein [Pedomonas sp.]|uniref:DUF2783 domain-containing protein n=1 Tax=Pedomonas sp. TaxID=2976421 RepID=UPI002F3E43F6